MLLLRTDSLPAGEQWLYELTGFASGECVRECGRRFFVVAVLLPPRDAFVLSPLSHQPDVASARWPLSEPPLCASERPLPSLLSISARGRNVSPRLSVHQMACAIVAASAAHLYVRHDSPFGAPDACRLM
jgi:hypothetical protein